MELNGSADSVSKHNDEHVISSKTVEGQNLVPMRCSPCLVARVFMVKESARGESERSLKVGDIRA